MAELNKVFLIGNIDGTPTSSQEGDGFVLLTFDLETRSFQNKAGEKGFSVVRHHIRYHTKSGKLVEYLTGGRLVYIEGALRPKGESYYIESYNLQLLGNSPKSESSSSSGPVRESVARNFDDDLPY